MPFRRGTIATVLVGGVTERDRCTTGLSCQILTRRVRSGSMKAWFRIVFINLVSERLLEITGKVLFAENIFAN
jgi:hypothetical protein